MKTNYSPYSRTYKFICLQNQLAHIKNKNNVHSQGKSNISICTSPERGGNNVIKKSSYHSTRPNFSSASLRDHSMG
jgi:hypothetical protein